VACGSLFVVVMGTALEGCVDPAPTYAAPERLPPVINAALVHPSPTTLAAITGDKVEFTVPFRSEDAGEDLDVAFVQDLIPEQKSGLPLAVFPVPADPRPFGDQADRAPISFTWSSLPEGCHSVTLILTHVSNFAGFFGTNAGLFATKDANDVAQVTWFFDIQNPADPSSQSHLVRDCPPGHPTGGQ
jgi:hypothetical protein